MFEIWLTFRYCHASSFGTPLWGLVSFQLCLDYRDHEFDDLMIWCHLIFWSLSFNAILGHISVSGEICRYLRSCMLIPTHEVHVETMTFSLFCDDPLVEPFGSHPVRHALLDLHDVIILHSRDSFWICEHDSVEDSDDRDYISVDAWFDIIWFFSTCHTFDAMLGHIFTFDWDLQIPTYLHDHPQLRDTCRVDDSIFILS